MSELNLEKLKKGLPGISPTTEKFLLESIKIALIKNGHQSGVILSIEGDLATKINLKWEENLTVDIIESWKNTRELANFAAVGLSILIIQHLTNFRSFEQSDIGTGIDYWMSSEQPEKGVFQKIPKEARLEISGIFKETSSNSVNMRVNLKKKQIQASDFIGLDGWVSIVEFSTPKTKIKKYESS